MNVLLAIMVALALPATAAGQEREDGVRGLEMTERKAAAVLLDDPESPDVWRAISLAVELGPRAGRQLRTAVIEAAWAELRREADPDPGRQADLDRQFMLFDAVVAARDPRAIPLMIESLRFGNGATNALADLGAAAFAPVLAAVSDPAEHGSRIRNGLTALRFMVEDGSLSVRQLEQIHELVRNRLSGPQSSFVASYTVRLALALNDPGLRRIVEQIAADRAYAEALVLDEFPSVAGSHDEGTNWVQKQARELLSGASPEPLRRRGGR